MTRYYSVSYETIEATEEQMAWYDNLWLQKTGVWRTVCDRETGEFLGACGFNYYDAATAQVQAGYWLRPKHWGKGYASEALRTAMDFQFDATTVRPLLASDSATLGSWAG